MTDRLKFNKKVLAVTTLIFLIVVLYFVLFISSSSFNLFSQKQKGDQKELTVEEVHERGGEVYYYGPNKTEVIYDPKYETPEQIEEMFKEWEEQPPETNQ